MVAGEGRTDDVGPSISCNVTRTVIVELSSVTSIWLHKFQVLSLLICNTSRHFVVVDLTNYHR
jgi:hypothetical protein